MVGELPDPERAGGLALREGDAIAVCGAFSPSLAGSELAKLRGELGPGLPSLPIAEVIAALDLVREAVRAARLSAAHDASDGGLACALAEMAIAGSVGLDVDLDQLVEARGCSGEVALFGEGPGGFVLAGKPGELEALAGGAVDLFVVGIAAGDRIRISAAEADADLPLADAERAWRSLGARIEEAAPA
jgi:phosphoribosylformylglycinamidine synthase